MLVTLLKKFLCILFLKKVVTSGRGPTLKRRHRTLIQYVYLTVCVSKYGGGTVVMLLELQF